MGTGPFHCSAMEEQFVVPKSRKVVVRTFGISKVPLDETAVALRISDPEVSKRMRRRLRIDYGSLACSFRGDNRNSDEGRGRVVSCVFVRLAVGGWGWPYRLYRSRTVGQKDILVPRADQQ